VKSSKDLRTSRPDISGSPISKKIKSGFVAFEMFNGIGSEFELDEIVIGTGNFKAGTN
jgi:hypothetical protein